jgi:hypothetical protein
MMTETIRTMDETQLRTWTISITPFVILAIWSLIQWT